MEGEASYMVVGDSRKDVTVYMSACSRVNSNERVSLLFLHEESFLTTSVFMFTIMEAGCSTAW